MALRLLPVSTCSSAILDLAGTVSVLFEVAQGDSMEHRKLGNSDLLIARIGVGAWAIGGGGWDFGWGPQDDSQSIHAIHAALDAGINWIDTAAVYGLGHS